MFIAGKTHNKVKENRILRLMFATKISKNFWIHWLCIVDLDLYMHRETERVYPGNAAASLMDWEASNVTVIWIRLIPVLGFVSRSHGSQWSLKNNLPPSPPPPTAVPCLLTAAVLVIRQHLPGTPCLPRTNTGVWRNGRNNDHALCVLIWIWISGYTNTPLWNLNQVRLPNGI